MKQITKRTNINEDYFNQSLPDTLHAAGSMRSRQGSAIDPVHEKNKQDLFLKKKSKPYKYRN